jgi:hypothetical protein
VVVRPDLQADDPVRRLPRPGHDDDPQVETLARIPGDSQSLLARQPDAEQHQVAEERAHGLGAVRLEDAIAMIRQAVLERVPNVGVVVDRQDVRGPGHGDPVPLKGPRAPITAGWR